MLRALIAACLALSALSGGQTQGQSQGLSPTRVFLGRSALGRPIVAVHVGTGSRVILVVGCIHGDECAGTAIVRRLERSRPRFSFWLLPNLNPDGYAAGHRQNGRGVDLNRNFPSQWRPSGRPWDVEYSGPRPASEPETRIAMRLILRLRPGVTIWYHQHQDLVRAWGGSVPMAKKYARLVGLPFRRLPWPAGAATNWQNHGLARTASFVVELPAGRLSVHEADRFARAALLLSK